MLLRQALHRAASLLRTNSPSTGLLQPSCLSTSNTRDRSHVSEEDVKTFNIKRVCLLKKITRYEYERHFIQSKSEAELKKSVSSQLLMLLNLLLLVVLVDLVVTVQTRLNKGLYFRQAPITSTSRIVSLQYCYTFHAD